MGGSPGSVPLPACNSNQVGRMLETLVVPRNGLEQVAQQRAVVRTQPLLDLGVQLGVARLRARDVEQFIGLDVNLLAHLVEAREAAPVAVARRLDGD